MSCSKKVVKIRVKLYLAVVNFLVQHIYLIFFDNQSFRTLKICISCIFKNLQTFNGTSILQTTFVAPTTNFFANNFARAICSSSSSTIMRSHKHSSANSSMSSCDPLSLTKNFCFVYFVQSVVDFYFFNIIQLV